MSRILFYKNVRRDGAVRTGIASGEEALYHRFTKGKGDPDPALAWYVDVEITGKRVPKEGRKVKKLLLEMKPIITRALDELTERVEVGWEDQQQPFAHRIHDAVSGMDVSIKGSALRRLRSTDIAKNLLHLKNNWENEIRKMPPVKKDSWDHVH